MAVDKEWCLSTALDIIKVHAGAGIGEKPGRRYLGESLEFLYEKLQALQADATGEE
jgi:hypothetical protein